MFDLLASTQRGWRLSQMAKKDAQCADLARTNHESQTPDVGPSHRHGLQLARGCWARVRWHGCGLGKAHGRLLWRAVFCWGFCSHSRFKPTESPPKSSLMRQPKSEVTIVHRNTNFPLFLVDLHTTHSYSPHVGAQWPRRSTHLLRCGGSYQIMYNPSHNTNPKPKPKHTVCVPCLATQCLC